MCVCQLFAYEYRSLWTEEDIRFPLELGTSIHELPHISTETQASSAKVQLPTTLHYAAQGNWGVFGDLFYPNNRSVKSYPDLKKD